MPSWTFMDPGTPTAPPGSPSRYAVLEASPNAIVAADLDGVIRYVNRQAADTFGYPVNELLGATVEMLLRLETCS